MVKWKDFTVEYNIWEKKINFENTKEIVAKFKERLRAEGRRQEKTDRVEDRFQKRRTTKKVYNKDII